MPPKKKTVKTPRCTCWHPLLPAFSARLVIAFRTLIGIACVAAFTLSPTTSQLIYGQLLIGVSFLVAIKSTLGATIQTAIRLFLGGAISAVYCLLIVNVFPRNSYYAIGATNLLVLLIVYTDLPVTVRRFTIVPTCIILLQWFHKDHIQTFFVLQIWTSQTCGALLAVLVTCIPLPLIPTAYRELTMRMRFIARQTRREVTAIILLISEYDNVRLRDEYELQINKGKQRLANANGNDDDDDDGDDDNDQGIEMPANSYREDDVCPHSASLVDLKDDHLLKSDIQDLNSLVTDELKQMQRALTEISYEPYFVLLKFFDRIRACLAHIPCIRKSIRSQSTLVTRLSIWATGFGAIQRTITGLLTLDHHHRAFVGQRQLINAICILLDCTFDLLDSTLPYTTSPTICFNEAQAATSRAKIEEALEDFFETYAQVRDNLTRSAISYTDAMRLNTFLLLMLRLVHATITAAEKSATPGARLDTSPEPTPAASKTKKSFDFKKPFHDLAAYIGLRPSFGKLVRASKTSLSVLISAVIVVSCHGRLKAENWIHWAPMTTALVSESSEGGTLRLSFQRLMAVLLGSTYAYLVVLITQNYLAVAICICLFVGLMGYLKADPAKEYFATVCAQSASIITFLSNQKGQMSASNEAALARTSLTFLGIFVHVFISNIFLPITARALIKKKVSIMIKNVSTALKSSSDDFCDLIGATITPQDHSSNKTSFNLMKTLSETERIADSFPGLLEEALNEPNLWKRPFIQVKDRYNDIAKSLRRISVDIRFVYRCTTILDAESKLHFAQEAKWLARRASMAHMSYCSKSKSSHAWTEAELRKQQQQLQKDLDIPVTIFMNSGPESTLRFEKRNLIGNSSSASFRLIHARLYQPVLEHFRTLEKNIQNVLFLTEKLIEKQASVDVGGFEMQQLCREDSYDEQQIQLLKKQRTLNRGPSFYAVPEFQTLPLVTNQYKFFSCCTYSEEDHEPLPSLRNAVDSMFTSLIQFLYANNRFIRTEFVSNQSVGDVLAFHTLSYALKDMVEATTDLAKSARRIKHIDTRTLTRTEREERIPD